MEAEWLIRILFAVIGLLGGVGVAHIAILRRLNETIVEQAKQGRDIKSAFGGLEQHDKRLDRLTSIQTLTMEHMTKVVDQNNLLIQKIIAQG